MVGEGEKSEDALDTPMTIGGLSNARLVPHGSLVFTMSLVSLLGEESPFISSIRFPSPSCLILVWFCEVPWVNQLHCGQSDIGNVLLSSVEPNVLALFSESCWCVVLFVFVS